MHCRLPLRWRLAPAGTRNLRFGDQVAEGDAEAVGHLLCDVQPQPDLAELDGADVGAVDPRERRQLFLRKAARFPTGPDNPAKRFADGIGHVG
jgi:hypothetical protein